MNDPFNVSAEKSTDAAPCPPAVRRMAKILVFATFVLLIAGALVTGNKAALSDPTWPKFVDHWYPKYWVGGLMYEDSHRLVAGTVGVLTLIMALMVQFSDKRGFMRKLGWSALVLVVVQALFGALIIKSIRHPAISMVHGVLAQTFFCLTIALAIFSSKAWLTDTNTARLIRPENKSFLGFMKLMIAVIFAQVVLGGGVRHSNDNGDMFFPFIVAHIGGAFLVIVVLVWFSLRVSHVYKNVKPLRVAARTGIAAIFVQVALGVLSIFANRARLNAGLAELHHVVFSTMHLLVGASLLAVMFGTYLRARNILGVGTDTRQVESSTAYAPSEAKA